MDRGGVAVGGIEADERVDLEVGKVEVDVDAVEAEQKVDEGLFLVLGHVLEEDVLDSLAGGEVAADGEVELEGFGVDVADVDASLVGKEDGVALAAGIDADVILGV